MVDTKNGKVKFDNIPKKNEEFISVTYGCIRFNDSYRFSSSCLDSLVTTLLDNTNKATKKLKKGFVDSDEKLNFVKGISKKIELLKI